MIEVILSGSVLILAVLLMRQVLGHKISKRLQYGLWLVVALRFLLPFSLGESAFSVLNFWHPKGPVPISMTEETIETKPMSVAEVIESAEERTETTTHFSKAENGVDGEGGYQSPNAPDRRSIKNLLYGLWVFGTLLVGAFFVLSNILFYKQLKKKRKKLAIKAPCPVYEVSDLPSPCLFGIFKPAIYLNAKALYHTQGLSYVLAHETMHYKHKDHLWSLLRGLLLALWWFHPLVWVAGILSKTDGELACDEAVLKRLDQIERFAYGETLLDMIAVKRKKGQIFSVATTMIADKKQIQKRIEAILTRAKPSLAIMLLLFVLSGLAVACTFTGQTHTSFEKRLMQELEVQENVRIYLEGIQEPLSVPGRKVSSLLTSLSFKEETKESEQTPVLSIQSIEKERFHIRLYDGPDYRLAVSFENKEKESLLSKAQFEKILKTFDYSGPFFTVFRLENGKETLKKELDPAQNDLAQKLILSGMVKSMVVSSEDVMTLPLCYRIVSRYENEESFSYYLYYREGEPAYGGDGIGVLQGGEAGHGKMASPISQVEYENFVSLIEEMGSFQLEKEISKAILSKNETKKREGFFPCTSYRLLGQEEKRDAQGIQEITVYLMVLYQGYEVKEGRLDNVEGYNHAVSMTFKREKDGSFKVSEYWIPKDGSFYAPSIQKKFPKALWDKAIDSQYQIQNRIQECHAKGISHFQIDTTKVVEDLLREVIRGHQDEKQADAIIKEAFTSFRALLYYGEYTVRYCFQRFEEGEVNPLQEEVMKRACQEILGLSKDRVSGRAWYEDFKEKAKAAYMENSESYIQRKMRGYWLLKNEVGF